MGLGTALKAVVRRYPISIVLGAIGLVWLFVTFRSQLQATLVGAVGHDFQDYYFSTKAFRLYGASIYDQPAMEALSRKVPEAGWSPPYVYPPYLTILFLPISYLRYVPARVLWLVLDYVFLFGTLEAVRRLCGFVGKQPVDWRLTLLVAIFAPSAFSPILDHNWYGQSNLLVLFIVSWGIYLEWKPPFRFPIGAVLLALGGLLKLFPLFLLPGYFAMRRIRTAFAIGIAAVVITGLTLLVIPFREFLVFPKVLDASMYVAKSQEQHFNDHSASSFLRYLVAPTVVPAFAIVLVRSIPYATHLLAFVKQETKGNLLASKPADLATLFRFAQSFVLLFCVMFRWWEHHLVMSVFPFFVAAYGCMRLQAPRALIACLAASALYIGAIGHPLLASWVDPHALPLNQGKFFAQLALFVVLEALIRRQPFEDQQIE